MKLKNCPFCGKEANVYKEKYYLIGCNEGIDCVGYYDRNFGWATESMAIEYWNKRYVIRKSKDYVDAFTKKE